MQRGKRVKYVPNGLGMPTGATIRRVKRFTRARTADDKNKTIFTHHPTGYFVRSHSRVRVEPGDFQPEENRPRGAIRILQRNGWVGVI